MNQKPQSENAPPQLTAVPRRTLRPKDAAKVLGIGERLPRTKTNCGEIPHPRLGGAILYPVAVLDEWLAQEVNKTMRRWRS